MKRELGSTFAVLQPDQSVTLVDVTPRVFEEINRRFGGFRGCVLISSFSFESNWPTWERHPVGDEIVCLLSGEARLVLERPGGEEVLFITPGEGTENRSA
jgi:hypothetical protein